MVFRALDLLAPYVQSLHLLSLRWLFPLCMASAWLAHRGVNSQTDDTMPGYSKVAPGLDTSPSLAGELDPIIIRVSQDGVRARKRDEELGPHPASSARLATSDEEHDINCPVLVCSLILSLYLTHSITNRPRQRTSVWTFDHHDYSARRGRLQHCAHGAGRRYTLLRETRPTLASKPRPPTLCAIHGEPRRRRVGWDAARHYHKDDHCLRSS